jgi:hypothetical protein
MTLLSMTMLLRLLMMLLMLRMTYLMLIRYWARATDSQLPEMVMVLSMLGGASRSSQFDIRTIAPDSCLLNAKGSVKRLFIK